jgi:hypothetical protein
MNIFLIFLLSFTIAYLLQSIWNLQYDIKTLKNEIEFLKGKIKNPKF